MLASEVAALLTIAAAVDHRRLDGDAGRAAVAVWADALEGLGFEECKAAIREHRLTAPGVYLEPGHIWQLAQASRSSRAPDGAEAERAALAAFVDYTGVTREDAAAHWNDYAWRSARLNEARHDHKRKALKA